MFPGIDPRQMKQAMKRMGINQQEIPAREVIIKCSDKEIVIHNPQVAKVQMMGQETWQISGDVEEHPLSTTPDINEEDIAAVVEQCNCSPEEAKAAIEKHNGDLAAAILELTEEE